MFENIVDTVLGSDILSHDYSKKISIYETTTLQAREEHGSNSCLLGKPKTQIKKSREGRRQKLPTHSFSHEEDMRPMVLCRAVAWIGSIVGHSTLTSQ